MGGWGRANYDNRANRHVVPGILGVQGVPGVHGMPDVVHVALNCML